MIARFRSWLTARLAWLDVMEDPGAIPEPVVDVCTCTPAAVGPRGSSCQACGGGVVYLSEHPTDAARRDKVRVLLDPARYVPTCEINASCERGDHSYSWPCEYAWGEDPDVVTDPKDG